MRFIELTELAFHVNETIHSTDMHLVGFFCVLHLFVNHRHHNYHHHRRRRRRRQPLIVNVFRCARTGKEKQTNEKIAIVQFCFSMKLRRFHAKN